MESKQYRNTKLTFPWLVQITLQGINAYFLFFCLQRVTGFRHRMIHTGNSKFQLKGIYLEGKKNGETNTSVFLYLFFNNTSQQQKCLKLFFVFQAQHHHQMSNSRTTAFPFKCFIIWSTKELLQCLQLSQLQIQVWF